MPISRTTPVKKRASITKFFESRIKREIKRAKKLGNGPAEMGWEKEARKNPVLNTQNISDAKGLAKSGLARTLFGPVYSIMARNGDLALVTTPKGSKKIGTLIHTHSERKGAFSIPDIRTFLTAVSENEKLRFNVVVAHDARGKVAGYSVAHYTGKIADAKNVLAYFEREWNKFLTKRYAEIEKEPERFAHIKIGENIHTFKEREQFRKEFLAKHKIKVRYVPVKGYLYNKRNARYQKKI